MTPGRWWSFRVALRVHLAFRPNLILKWRELTAAMPEAKLVIPPSRAVAEGIRCRWRCRTRACLGFNELLEVDDFISTRNR
jgi:hypothetical protein